MEWLDESGIGTVLGRAMVYQPGAAVSSSFSCAESTRTTACTEFVAGDMCTPWPKPSVQGIAGEVRPLTLYKKIVGCCSGQFDHDEDITTSADVFYSSSNPAVATVSNSLFNKGQVTFQGPGRCEIRAEYQGQQHVCETFCGVGGLATARTKVDRTGMNGAADPVNFILPGGCQICQTFATTFTAVIDVQVNAPGVSVTLAAITAVPKNQTSDVEVTLSPSPSPTPVTLTLSTTSGAGSARFGSNNSTTLTITQSQLVSIKGVTQSSTADNIRLEATASGNSVANEDFSALWVTLELRTSGSLSVDNSARATYITDNGTDQLGTFFSTGQLQNFWRTGVEVVGIVEPGNFTGMVMFKRSFDFRGYNNMTQIDSRTGTEIPRSKNTDADPQSGGSAGKVYNVDNPGFTGSGDAGTIFRGRTNFVQWAEFDGKRVSDDLSWFSRLSIIKTMGNDELRQDIPGDNIAGAGTTRLSWNLQ